MRFPGRRIAKHYFPVTRQVVREAPRQEPDSWYLVGLDQIVVDVEVRLESKEQLWDLGLIPGESVVVDSARQQEILERLGASGAQIRVTPGGAVGNTLNNYRHLSGERAILLGTIPATIRPGDHAFQYVAGTPEGVDLTHLVPVEGPMGSALTLISPDGDRAFAVDLGVSNDYPPDALPDDLIRGATVAMTTLYCLRDPGWPIAAAATRMMEVAREADVPVAFGLGTSTLVRENRERIRGILEDYVTIAAMNSAEAEALTGQSDALLACERILDWVDVVIVTQGPKGLTLAGYVDDRYKRQTKQVVRSKSIPEYNKWEYSRLMRKEDCEVPIKIYSHIHPYRGGPEELGNTNGAGDAALAALLHDVAANRYHRAMVPDSGKHAAPVPFLTYSSLSRNAQYGNRVAYEVLTGMSPRLSSPVGSDEDPPTRAALSR